MRFAVADGDLARITGIADTLERVEARRFGQGEGGRASVRPMELGSWGGREGSKAPAS